MRTVWHLTQLSIIDYLAVRRETSQNQTQPTMISCTGIRKNK
ncbi:hypothetical protein RMSM_07822 [Rhodopirellula maiorica SM1]|uniref:Uncharacterized protein n=1 Tax=Rhodopirellula maiorica SM1 TaxID=1265738 RepID=M5R899_9BACT|nr:hypothetical protein RMSM_07822 [Rhodopirellula maiorica SM1]